MGNLIMDRNRLWPNGLIPFEIGSTLGAIKPKEDVSAPVGAGGVNKPADVALVIKLLNEFSPAEGGPSPKLDPEKPDKTRLIQAITFFQQTHFGWSDGRVDPTKPTIIELNNDPFDGNPYEGKKLILAAIQDWNSMLGGSVRWVWRHGQENFVKFENTTGVSRSTSIGMDGGEQKLLINTGAARHLAAQFGGTVKGVILHEMGHAAGLAHEQSRTDRDKFVFIDKDNIRPGRERDFRITTDCKPVGNYDFLSTMHYFFKQAAKDESKPVIFKLGPDGKPFEDSMMGTLKGFSAGDLSTLGAAYGSR